jgi:poly [ADP-ribose] polymerase
MTTPKEQMLIKVSAQENNNKFYHVSLDENGVVTKRWGRVGAAGASSTESSGELGYERTIREKTKRGYKPTAIVGNVAKPQNEQLSTVAKKVLAGVQGDPVIDSLIEKLVAINRHEIMESSGGMIKVNTDGVITTPLGLIGNESIKEAKKVLDQIKKERKKSQANIVPLLEDYLRLVPQKVPRQRGWQETFFEEDKALQYQFDFLKQLKDSVSWYDDQKKAVSAQEPEDSIEEKYAKLFKFKIGTLSNSSQEFARIEKMYSSTKHSAHSASNLKLKRVFTLTDEEGDETYSKVLQSIGNERQLWHGTRAFNVLSILRKGLFVPPLTGRDIPIAGRMFGDGVYFSTESTKSLNYSHGYWTAGGRENNCFMFLADVAMGREFKPSYFNHESLEKAHYGKDRFGKPFNSIHIRPNTCGVRNNEIIVWNTDAIRLRYICEFDAR